MYANACAQPNVNVRVHTCKCNGMIGYRCNASRMHGKHACIIDGCPPGLSLSAGDLQHDLNRRKPGQSRYTTQRKEDDEVEILSGVFEGVTTGTPIGLMVRNQDQKSKDYSKIN